jgi:hypothetical protein
MLGAFRDGAGDETAIAFAPGCLIQPNRNI